MCAACSWVPSEVLPAYRTDGRVCLHFSHHHHHRLVCYGDRASGRAVLAPPSRGSGAEDPTRNTGDDHHRRHLLPYPHHDPHIRSEFAQLDEVSQGIQRGGAAPDDGVLHPRVHHLGGVRVLDHQAAPAGVPRPDPKSDDAADLDQFHHHRDGRPPTWDGVLVLLRDRGDDESDGVQHQAQTGIRGAQPTDDARQLVRDQPPKTRRAR